MKTGFWNDMAAILPMISAPVLRPQGHGRNFFETDFPFPKKSNSAFHAMGCIFHLAKAIFKGIFFGIRTPSRRSSMLERRPRGRPRAFHDKTDQNTIQSLDRAMVILDRLASSGGMTLSEIASSLDQSPATAYRVLTTLAGRAIVEHDALQQTWHVGAGAFRIGSAFLRRTNLVERARPVMRALMEVTGETANLGVEQGDMVLFVSQVETHESIRAFFPPGTRSPMHASGIGKALLAQYPEPRVRAIAARGLDRFTARSLTDADTLLADLAATRTRGYAIDDEEKNDGMRCVAAPIFNATGEPVAGISISGPAARVTPVRLASLGAEVRRAADTLSRALGADRETSP
jgi:IclR family transcriptional regulator, acetate operon repressor